MKLTKNQIAAIFGEPYGLKAREVLDLLSGKRPVYWAGPVLENGAPVPVPTGKPLRSAHERDLSLFFPLPVSG